MLNKSLILSVVITLTLIQIIENRTSLKWTGISCESVNQNFCRFKVCRVKAIKRGIFELSVYVQLLQKPADNITVTINFGKRNAPAGNSYYKYRVDACEFLSNRRRNPFIAMFYQLLGLEEHSNMNHSCPYDHDIILEAYAINQNYTNLLPFPVGHYSITTSWYSSLKLRANVNATLEIY